MKYLETPRANKSAKPALGLTLHLKNLDDLLATDDLQLDTEGMSEAERLALAKKLAEVIGRLATL